MIILCNVAYPEGLEIKDSIDTPKWATNLDIRVEFDEDGIPYSRFNDIHDDLNFQKVNFPYLNFKQHYSTQGVMLDI